MWHIAGDNRYQACFLPGGTAFAVHQQDDQAGALAMQSHGLQQRCTSADKRWVTRHFYEAAFVRSETRLAESRGLLFERMAAVERPFGVTRHLPGMLRFQCVGLEKAGRKGARSAQL